MLKQVEEAKEKLEGRDLLEQRNIKQLALQFSLLFLL